MRLMSQQRGTLQITDSSKFFIRLYVGNFDSIYDICEYDVLISYVARFGIK